MCLRTSDLSHKPVVRPSLCLKVPLPACNVGCGNCSALQMFGIGWNASVGRGGAGEASRTSSQISDILVKSSYRDVGQISSLETRDGGVVREGTRDQM